MEGIAYAGQPFMDEKVYVEISRATQASLAVNMGLRTIGRESVHPFGEKQAQPDITELLQEHIAQHQPRISPRITPRIQEFSHMERVRLNWLKPDGKGGLIPRNQDAKGRP